MAATFKLIRAIIMLAKKKKQDKAAGKVVSSAAGPGGILTSFSDGIQHLSDPIALSLGEIVKPGVTVSSVEKKNSFSYRVMCQNGLEYDADCAIVASPAFATAEMLAALDAEIAL
jgi:oxygen-dependent protoporphyrinogen oxidase